MSSSSQPPVKGAVYVDYRSNAIAIPSSFLTSPPSTTPTCHIINFADNNLPEFHHCTAFTIDNALSPEECNQLLHLAESSVPLENESSSPWRPAMVAIGHGWEISMQDYRHSDRIIWDRQEVADRILARCLLADGVKDILSHRGTEDVSYWKLHSLNERMRFLKYTKDQFFKPHCDSSTDIIKDGKKLQTFFTLHLYLNDSSAESTPNDDNDETTLIGGATSFLSSDGKRRLDVSPKAGSVLIFQHSRLRHEGATVTQGTKYTVRSDIFYEEVRGTALSQGASR